MSEHDAFTQIVERDLKGNATPEERALLESDLDQWDHSLSLLYTEALDNLGTLKLRKEEAQAYFLAQGPKGKAAWFERKLELDRKRTKTRNFSQYVSRKRFEVKQLKQKRDAEKKSTPPSPDHATGNDTDLMFPSAVGELLSMLLHSKKPKVHTDLFLAAFVVRVIQLYDKYAPGEEEILDRICKVEPDGIMDFWDPEELEGLA